MVEFESDVLRGNPAGDPHVRRVRSTLPPSSRSRRGPGAFPWRTRSRDSPAADGCCSTTAFSPSLDDRLDGLIASGRCGRYRGHADCWTRFGGSQYLDSRPPGATPTISWTSSCHRWTRTCARCRRASTGVIGKSSGGFGALTLGAQAPGVFGAVASQRRRLLRVLLPGRHAAGLHGAPALGRGPRPFLEGVRREAAEGEGRLPRLQHPRDGGGLLARPGRRAGRRPAVRPRDRRDSAGRLAALARVRPAFALAEAIPDALRSPPAALPRLRLAGRVPPPPRHRMLARLAALGVPTSTLEVRRRPRMNVSLPLRRQCLLMAAIRGERASRLAELFATGPNPALRFHVQDTGPSASSGALAPRGRDQRRSCVANAGVCKAGNRFHRCKIHDGTYTSRVLGPPAGHRWVGRPALPRFSPPARSVTCSSTQAPAETTPPGDDVQDISPALDDIIAIVSQLLRRCSMKHVLGFSFLSP